MLRLLALLYVASASAIAPLVHARGVTPFGMGSHLALGVGGGARGYGAGGARQRLGQDLVSGRRCDFAAAGSVRAAAASRMPAILRSGVIAEGLAARFALPELLARYGRKLVQHAHPAYHVLAEGNSEQRMPLREFVSGMRRATPANVSFVFDSLPHSIAGGGVVGADQLRHE